MFIERNTCDPNARSGWIEVIAGCMFSGKTEELIRRIKRSQIAKQKVAVFKPSIDKRYDKTKVVSHDKTALPSKAVKTTNDILKLSKGFDVVGIDEAQFFDDSIIDVANDLANSGTRVIIAGLDMDFTGKPFGPMPQLMAIAEFVTKVNAICPKTGEVATHSFKHDASDKKQIHVGEKDVYEARTRKAFFEGMRGRKTYRTVDSKRKLSLS